MDKLETSWISALSESSPLGHLMNTFTISGGVLVECKVLVTRRHARLRGKTTSYVELLELHARVFNSLNVFIDIPQSLPDSKFPSG